MNLLPENLGLFVGVQGNKAKAIEQALKSTDLEKNLELFGTYWRIKIEFSEPVRVWKRGWKEVTTYVAPGFFISSRGTLCVAFRRPMRRGLPVDWLNKIVRYELVSDDCKFESYEQFKSKFDPIFITESKIQELWNGTSSQHGGKYTPNDFRRLGRIGLAVLEEFLRSFNGVTSSSPEYVNENGRLVLRKRYTGYKRDITITHDTNKPLVWYASEIHGYGNGRYGLIANRREFLWLEDD